MNKGNTLFPVFLKLAELNTLIIGGGNVALEKLTAVLQNSPDARVKVVARLIKPEVRSFLDGNTIPFEEREFSRSDLEGVDLAIIAINDRGASRRIHESCKLAGVLANVADTPDFCDFYLGSIVRKGNLKIAISTNGKSPTIAKRIKDTLNETLPEEMDDVLDNMSRIRNSLEGDFSEKVRQLNQITSVLATGGGKEAGSGVSMVKLALYLLGAVGLMYLGHLLF